MNKNIMARVVSAFSLGIFLATILGTKIVAMDLLPDWQKLVIHKDGILLEYERIYSACSLLGKRLPGIYKAYSERLELDRKYVVQYAGEIDAYCQQLRRTNRRELSDLAQGRISYIEQFLDRIRSVSQILEDGAKEQGAHKVSDTESERLSLCESVLRSHRINDAILSPGMSVQLRLDGQHEVGYVRAYPGMLVIELKGASQKCSMSCGAAAYAYAAILDKIHDYPRCIHALRDEGLLKYYENELRDSAVQKMTEVWGHEDAPREWDRMMQAEGISFDLLYGPVRGKGLDLFTEDTVSRDLFSVGRQEKSKIILLLVGQNVSKGVGHWIALQLERMRDGRLGIIFADSCPYARDEHGRIIEAVDKIAAYDRMFLKWASFCRR
jgi:hypothetical protein